MKVKPFSAGDEVYGIRDLEMSHKGVVVGHEQSERGFVLVRFGDEIPRLLPVASLQRAADRKDEPRSRPIGGNIWEESKDLGDYMRRMGEADSMSKKEQHK